MDIILDFDGTVVTSEFPQIGEDIGAAPVLKELVEFGHNLILFTMRSDMPEAYTKTLGIVNAPGAYLTDAINWFQQRSIPLYGIQKHPTQHAWTSSPKAYGDIMIDDKTLGCPLVYGKHKSPYVDWVKIRELLVGIGCFSE
ncbi:MAG: hypothetical protein JNL51_18665 [Chitinophagaceae bacterium]|nr:hypothetical protein [Chitinophagaceae bacterium]